MPDGAPRTRIVERLADYRPLFDALMAEPADERLRARYAGTELVDCTAQGCWRAVIVAGRLDIAVTLELVDDEGWAFIEGWHWCPDHRAGTAPAKAEAGAGAGG